VEISFSLLIVIVLGWIYAFYMGANDSANSIAASIACRAMSPRLAILLASALTFLGAFFGLEVAKTIGKGLISQEFMTFTVVLSAIIGAVSWVALATAKGLPVSMTQSIIGGIIGAGVTAYGFGAINWMGFSRVIIGIVTSPIGAFIGVLIIIFTVLHLFKNVYQSRASFIFSKAQIFSTGFLSFSFGMNNTQNTVGVIAAGLLGAGITQEFYVPLWVTLSCAFFISLGILLGGKNVIKTVGMRLSKLKPVHGFSADFASALVIFSASSLGLPISTTHVTVTSVMAVRGQQRLSAVRWPVFLNIVHAWILTIPSSAGIGAITYFLLNFIM